MELESTNAGFKWRGVKQEARYLVKNQPQVTLGMQFQVIDYDRLYNLYEASREELNLGFNNSRKSLGFSHSRIYLPKQIILIL